MTFVQRDLATSSGREGIVAMTDKAEAMEAIRNLPEFATFAEIIETLAILEGIRKGDKAIEAGDYATQDVVEAMLESWITKSAGLVSRWSPSRTSWAILLTEASMRPNSLVSGSSRANTRWGRRELR